MSVMATTASAGVPTCNPEMPTVVRVIATVAWSELASEHAVSVIVAVLVFVKVKVCELRLKSSPVVQAVPPPTAPVGTKSTVAVPTGGLVKGGRYVHRAALVDRQ